MQLLGGYGASEQFLDGAQNNTTVGASGHIQTVNTFTNEPPGRHALLTSTTGGCTCNLGELQK